MLCSKQMPLSRASRVPFAGIQPVALLSRRERVARERHGPIIHAVAPQEEEKLTAAQATEKYGLEAGLFKVLSSPKQEGEASKTDQAKKLLAQYGSAYLITSISFAAVSFALCYFAVTAGVDVASLLSKVGIEVNKTSETVGSIAIAYAAHKALSPVRFPPTVALTPVVAKWIGQKMAGSGENASQSQ